MSNGNGDFAKLYEILLVDIRRRRAKLKQQLMELDEAEKAMEITYKYESRAFETIEKETNMQPLLSDDIQGKSKREVLHLIARRNNGWLIAQLGIQLMMQAGLLSEDSGSAEVYTLLGQNKDEFIRVKPGIYYLSDFEREITELLQKAETRVRLVDKVAILRAEHPTWKAKNVCQELLHSGWDFGNKTPIFAVTMSFAYLAKRKKAQERKKSIGGRRENE